MKEGQADEYAERVLALDRDGVVKTWEDMQAGYTPEGWPAGKLLEYLLLRGFLLEGARVKWPYLVYRDFPVEQLDGVVHFAERSWLLECKHQQEPVDILPILKLKSQLARRPEGVGALFSMGGFTESAKRLAQMLPPANVLLWERKEIDLALRHGKLRQGMVKKLEFAVENGFSDLELLTLEDYEWK
jgi:hypothetical protein